MECGPWDLPGAPTIFLIITSITIFGYIISVITDYIANNKFIEELKFKQVQKKIQRGVRRCCWRQNSHKPIHDKKIELMRHENLF